MLTENAELLQCPVQQCFIFHLKGVEAAAAKIGKLVAHEVSYRPYLAAIAPFSQLASIGESAPIHKGREVDQHHGYLKLSG